MDIVDDSSVLNNSDTYADRSDIVVVTMSDIHVRSHTNSRTDPGVFDTDVTDSSNSSDTMFVNTSGTHGYSGSVRIGDLRDDVTIKTKVVVNNNCCTKEI